MDKLQGLINILAMLHLALHIIKKVIDKLNDVADVVDKNDGLNCNKDSVFTNSKKDSVEKDFFDKTKGA